MIARLKSSTNPNFFLLNYNQGSLSINNFLVIPKHFFVPRIIEERKALSPRARRAGWIGCNIILRQIPQKGKIFYLRDGKVQPKNKVLEDWQKTLFLREQKEVKTRGWIIDVMNCIDSLQKKEFTLNEVYGYEKVLQQKYPNNRHVKDKIRQQLQLLRDKGYLKFIRSGHYRLS